MDREYRPTPERVSNRTPQARWTPLFARVLVRVLPREEKLRGIWVPDNKQNKPTWEGVVIKTYKPFYLWLGEF